jgi:hypothetical protein
LPALTLADQGDIRGFKQDEDRLFLHVEMLQAHGFKPIVMRNATGLENLRLHYKAQKISWIGMGICLDWFISAFLPKVMVN